MAVTQYVGARYVPLIADPVEWDSQYAYEPLTIVLHEGNSYTSRQYVPKGVDISNAAFWALTGNYNAQVELYRQEVQNISARTPNNIYTYNTVADVKNSPAKPGELIKTLGYYAAGDGGNALYVVTTTFSNNPDSIPCGNYTAQCVKVDCEPINVCALGCKTNAECTDILQFALNTYKDIYVPKISLTLDKALTLPQGASITSDGAYLSTKAPIVITSSNTIKGVTIAGDSNTIGISFDNGGKASRNSIIEKVNVQHCSIAFNFNRSWINKIADSNVSSCPTSIYAINEVNAITFDNCNFEYHVEKLIVSDTSCGGVFFENCCIESLTDTLITDRHNTFYNSLYYFNGCYLENRGTEQYPALTDFTSNNCKLIVHNTTCAYHNPVSANGFVLTDNYSSGFSPTLINTANPTVIPTDAEIGLVALSNPVFSNYNRVVNFRSLTWTYNNVWTCPEYPDLFFIFYDTHGLVTDSLADKQFTLMNAYTISPMPEYVNVCIDVTYQNTVPEDYGKRCVYRPAADGQEYTPQAISNLAVLKKYKNRQYCWVAKTAAGTQGSRKYTARFMLGSTSNAVFTVNNIALG